MTCASPTELYVSKILVVLALLIALPILGEAQQPIVAPRPALADSSPARILRTTGGLNTPVIVEVLRQVHQPYPAAKREELADSVAARALNSPSYEAAIGAINTLNQAGNLQGHGSADLFSLDRLIQVHKAGRNEDTRLYALSVLIFQAQPGRALPYLRTVAASADGRSAFWALQDLESFAFGVWPIGTSDRATAENTLRQLYDADSMQSSRAISELCEVGALHRWPGSPKCQPRR